jgi:hypothetical protein
MSADKTPIDEFLNPKSMVTPGVAGAVTMLITNTLSSQFGLLPNYTGLVISLIFGLVVFLAQSQANWLVRIIYYFLNSLIIFSVAMGTNQAGLSSAKAAEPKSPQPALAKTSTTAPFFANWLDGTVGKRKEILAEVHNLGDAKATKALDHLKIPIPTGESPKSVLAGIVSGSRTADDIHKYQAAMTAAHGFGD